mmetsp:Transcript_67301/g.197582  ORF Transcript_67301/g.197582 Transcript_67301/m.197582 type:complete len:205 (+) Transcript_67301:1603-2217(+)
MRFGAQGVLPRLRVRAAVLLAGEAELVDHEARRREGDREDVVQADADRRVPAAGPHGHDLGDGHGEEGARRGDGGVQDGAGAPRPRGAEGLVNVAGEGGVTGDVPPAVHEHEDVVRPDAQDEVDHEDVEELKVAHHEDLPVDDARDRKRGQDLEHARARQEAGAEVGPHADEDEEEGAHGQGEVGPDHPLELVRVVEDSHPQVA